jgi:pimeloyl-ACP methyl ester carboxylesterase
MLQDTEAAILWAGERFQSGPILLAGLGSGAADAMHFSLRRPDLCRGVLLAAGPGFNPWPGRELSQLIKLLGTQPNPLVYTLVTVPGSGGDSGQAPLLATALQEAGFHLDNQLSEGKSAARAPFGDLIAAWVKKESLRTGSKGN